MILCIGEILADLIGKEENGRYSYDMFIGGAPFNVAVNAKRAGAKVGFIGRVGKDPIGKFLITTAKKVNLDYTDIQTDGERNTTLAIVSLNNGERDFAFFRHDAADFNIDISKIDIKRYTDLNIVHLGSLMLSEEKGRVFAGNIVKTVKNEGKLLSFDVNFRMDLYNDTESAIKAYKPFIEAADILKFSDDEIKTYTKKEDLGAAVKAVKKENTLLLISMGSRGSMYVYNDLSGVIPSKKVVPVDTTGAGDAFFGTVLAYLDGKEFTKENIEIALKKGNEAGAGTVLFKGAIKI